MRFSERREFHYDPEVFHLHEIKVAMKMHAEYVVRHSARPPPTFFEIDRSQANIDPLWHMPQGPRTQFSRELLIPALNVFDKPIWKHTKIGNVPQRRDVFWLASLSLQPPTEDPELAKVLEMLHIKQHDYFPQRGDMVYWNGYRYMIENVVLDPKSYWQQTNVWLGLVVECIIPPEGDARPVVNPGVALPAEKKEGL